MSVYEDLKKEVEYAKTTVLPIRSLYYAYGQIKMALSLGAITSSEFSFLNHECVTCGINNPKYIK